MPLTEQYLRYANISNFNVVASSNCNVEFVVQKNEIGRFCAVGAAEHIIIWDLRSEQKVLIFHGLKYPVTCLKYCLENDQLAAGYEDGTIKTFSLSSNEELVVYSGHRSAVTCLDYHFENNFLVSASFDCSIIIWDIMAECGRLRLNGHLNAVTNVVFLKYNIIASASKDGSVKLWNINIGHCFETLIEHRTEVWGLTVLKKDNLIYLVTGSAERELKAWYIEDSPETEYLKCVFIGTILRCGRGRVVSLKSDRTSHVLACHGTDNIIELFYIYSSEKLKNKRRKRGIEGPDMKKKTVSSIKNIVSRLPVIKVNGLVKNINLMVGEKDIRVAVLLSTNIVELYSMMNYKMNCNRTFILCSLNNQGHRTEVKALAFSSDSIAIASGSSDQIKLWNRSSLTCLQTTENCSCVLCLCFVPGDRHLLAGLKNGNCLILDISSQHVTEEIPAHKKELWAIDLLPDKSGFATGSSDCTVKFWKFELIDDKHNNSRLKLLSALHIRSLKLDEKILALKVSPNNTLVAVALLDCTVKIFFLDTLKFFLCLYGHSLPVLSLDISSDSALIATGSADKNVKIWGLDFGDCHKSVLAHDDSVLSLKFIPKTHRFITCGKDGFVKEWDADSFKKIQTVSKHHGIAWCLAVSDDGKFIVSSGSDKVLRLCESTSKPLVLEDEAEEERVEDKLATGKETIVPGHISLNLPSKKTISCEKGAEHLLDCLKIFQMKNQQQHYIPPLMEYYKISAVEDFLVENLSRIKSCDLEEALAILPFTSACELLTLLCKAIPSHNDKAELLCRTAMFLLRVHYNPLAVNKDFLSVLNKFEVIITEVLLKSKNLVGYNLYVLLSLQHNLEQQQRISLFKNAVDLKRNRCKKRAILSV